MAETFASSEPFYQLETNFQKKTKKNEFDPKQILCIVLYIVQLGQITVFLVLYTILFYWGVRKWICLLCGGGGGQ